MNEFAERLKESRIEMGLSRKTLAEMCGASVKAISQWEVGRSECDFDMLIKLSTALDISIDYLLGKTDY